MKASLLALLLAGTAYAQSLNLPTEKPVSATGISICQSNQKVLLMMIVTFADGRVIRISSKNMHGLDTPEQIIQYGLLAKDFIGIDAPCEPVT